MTVPLPPCINDSGLDLTALSVVSQLVVDEFNQILLAKQLRYTYHPPISRTEAKPNYARMEVDICSGGGFCRTGYNIVFVSADGTGDAKTYVDGTLKIPEGLRFDEKPERVYPRKKTCVLEAVYNLGSVIEGKFYPGITSLVELTVDDVKNPQTIVELYDLGLPKEVFRGVVKFIRERGQSGELPEIEEVRKEFSLQYPILNLTTDRRGLRNDEFGEGDPHTIFSSEDVPYVDAQMVLFDAITDPNDGTAGLYAEKATPTV